MRKRATLIAAGFGLAAMLVVGLAPGERSTYRWTKFVQVEGQPEPVPVEWVATPEGKFAHSINIPNPVPKDSGYRWWMTSEQYFEHLCKTEAGEFIFKTVENVEGLYFMRPPNRPKDDDLEDRYKLEAPDIERTFQLKRAVIEERATIFVAPPYNNFRFVEEPNREGGGKYRRAFGYVGGKAPMQVESADSRMSTYAMVWRGIRRLHDREHAIAGSEWLIFDFNTNQVLAVMRNYGRTGKSSNTPDGIWWLGAASCPIFAQRYKFATSEKISDFAQKVLKPIPPHKGSADGK